MGCKRDAETAPPSQRLPVEGSVLAIVGPRARDLGAAAFEGGARRAARQHPYLRLEYITPAAAQPSSVAAAVEQALAAHPAAICVFVPGSGLAPETVDRLRRCGKQVVTAGTAQPELGAYAHIGANWADGAELLADHLNELAAGRKSYVLLTRRKGDAVDRAMYDRFIPRAKQESLALLDEQDAARSGEPEEELLRRMLERYRHAGLVVTLTPTVWLADRPRFELPGAQRFATIGAGPALWPRLRTGEAAGLVGPLDGEIGAGAVEFAVQGLMGAAAGGTRLVSCELVTPATLDDFAERYAAAGGLELRDIRPPTISTQPVERSSTQPSGR